MIAPYYDDGLCTIYHGRCEEILPDIERADIVVTSPPYNMGLTPGGNGRGMYRPGSTGSKGARFRDGYDGANDDAMEQGAYDEWQREILRLCWGKANRAVFYNHRPRVEHGLLRLPLGMDFGGLPLRQIIIVDRGTGIDVNLTHFCTRQEWILLFAKPTFRLVDHAASGMGDVWRLGMEHTKHGHPAPFPLGLPARAIAASGARSVIDPFMGSGTTLRAAADAGIRAIGIEKVERHCETAVARLTQQALAF